MHHQTDFIGVADKNDARGSTGVDRRAEGSERIALNAVGDRADIVFDDVDNGGFGDRRRAGVK